MSAEIKSRAEWAKGGSAQTTVKRAELRDRVREILARIEG
jgi:hypothetical protein